MAKKDEFRVRASLPPLYARLIDAESKYTGGTMSGIVATAIKARYDAMPIKERERILQLGEK